MIKLRKDAKPKSRLKANDKISEAKNAVEEFEKTKHEYFAARDEWEEEYEEANEALKEVEEKKSQAQSLWEKAKKLVAAAETTVGDFHCTVPKTSPGYDGKKLLSELSKVATEHNNPKGAGQWLAELYDRGIITGFTVDKDAAKVIHQGNNGALTDFLELAHDPGGKPLTPRIKGPIDWK